MSPQVCTSEFRQPACTQVQPEQLLLIHLKRNLNHSARRPVYDLHTIMLDKLIKDWGHEPSQASTRPDAPNSNKTPSHSASWHPLQPLHHRAAYQHGDICRGPYQTKGHSVHTVGLLGSLQQRLHENSNRSSTDSHRTWSQGGFPILGLSIHLP